MYKLQQVNVKTLKSCCFLVYTKDNQNFPKPKTSKFNYKKSSFTVIIYQNLHSIALRKLSKIFIVLKTSIHYSNNYSKTKSVSNKKRIAEIFSNILIVNGQNFMFSSKIWKAHQISFLISKTTPSYAPNVFVNFLNNTTICINCLSWSQKQHPHMHRMSFLISKSTPPYAPNVFVNL